jgi:hypothetical protein
MKLALCFPVWNKRNAETDFQGTTKPTTSMCRPPEIAVLSARTRCGLVDWLIPSHRPEVQSIKKCVTTRTFENPTIGQQARPAESWNFTLYLFMIYSVSVRLQLEYESAKILTCYIRLWYKSKKHGKRSRQWRLYLVVFYCILQHVSAFSKSRNI